MTEGIASKAVVTVLVATLSTTRKTRLANH